MQRPTRATRALSRHRDPQQRGPNFAKFIVEETHHDSATSGRASTLDPAIVQGPAAGEIRPTDPLQGIGVGDPSDGRFDGPDV